MAKLHGDTDYKKRKRKRKTPVPCCPKCGEKLYGFSDRVAEAKMGAKKGGLAYGKQFKVGDAEHYRELQKKSVESRRRRKEAYERKRARERVRDRERDLIRRPRKNKKEEDQS